MSLSEIAGYVQEIASDNRSGASKLALKVIDIYQDFIENAIITNKRGFLKNLSTLARLIREA